MGQAMTRSFSYSVLQLTPDPVRDERVNVGVLVFDFDERLFSFRALGEATGLKKKVGDAPVVFVRSAIDEMQRRVAQEMSRRSTEHSPEAGISALIASRANIIRMLPLRPTFGDNAEAEADRIFEAMVALEPQTERRTRVAASMKKRLRELNVLHRFDQNPAAVSLPRYHTKVQADLGARKETYHLIRAVRFDNPEKGLSFIGKNALVARALAERHSMKLVVVGDFGDQPNDYFRSVKEDLEREKASVYRLNDMQSFANDYQTLH